MVDPNPFKARWRPRSKSASRGKDARRRVERFRFTDDAAYFAFLVDRANQRGSDQ